LHQVISTSAGLLLAAAYFALAGRGGWVVRLRPFLFAVPLGLLLLQPRVLQGVLNWILARFHRPALEVTMTWGRIWLLLLRYIVVWLIQGLAFATLVRALAPLPLAGVPYVAAAWVAAYVIGFLSLLTPSGLGVREGVIVLLLAAILPQPVAAVIAILARLWTIAGEAIAAGLALATRRRPAFVPVDTGMPPARRQVADE
jgi:hypothetical protein